jgi:thiosulfate/3-mercaptopyruvate sulfurtransferase
MRPLISTTDLATALAGPAGDRPVVLDVRWRLAGPPGADSYREGHVPGAVFADLDRVLAAEPGDGGRHPLPDPADLQRDLRAAGVRAGAPVVAYDDADGSVAARAWWLLRWAGHDEVAILDGGYAAWTAGGHPVSTDEVHPEPGDLEVRPGGMPVLDADEAAALARDGLLLDARAPQRYTGETEPVDPRPGHIPGAVNAPFAAHTDDGGTWRTPEELAARFAELGLRPGEPVGAYCGSGVTASSVVLALELAGHPGAGLYAGSWSHWSRDPQRPAATGPLPG